MTKFKQYLMTKFKQYLNNQDLFKQSVFKQSTKTKGL
jgi:hypothetical protein